MRIIKYGKLKQFVLVVTH